jgi:hypothetical protein
MRMAEQSGEFDYEAALLACARGEAPKSACDAASKGKKEVVAYSADYVMWTAK